VSRDDIILEDINGKFDLILELVEPLAPLPSIDRRLKNVESDVKIIKRVVTGHSKQLHDHESRLKTLEKFTN
jgi:hypothetical protein